MHPAPTQTLLLVEDEEDDVLFMKRALKAVGIVKELQVAQDGAQAIEYLRTRLASKDLEQEFKTANEIYRALRRVR